jgi:hypothetical protein
MADDGIVLSAKEKHRLKRMTNHAVLALLEPHGFHKGRTADPDRNFQRLRLTDTVYLELSLNDQISPSHFDVAYQPIVWIQHQVIEGLHTKCAVRGPKPKYGATVEEWLYGLAHVEQLVEWSVTNEFESAIASGKLAQAVLDHAVPFAQRVSELDQLIEYLLPRTYESPGRLPIALALAERWDEFDVALLWPVLFRTNPVLEVQAADQARAAIGLLQELERGLELDSYAGIEREYDRTRAAREKGYLYQPRSREINELMGHITAAGDGRAGYTAFNPGASDAFAYPGFRRPLTDEVDGEVVIVAVRETLTGPIRFLPLVGVTHHRLQRLYTKISRTEAVASRYQQPFSHRLALHRVAGRPIGDAWMTEELSGIPATLARIFAEVGDVAEPWMEQLADLETLATTVSPYQDLQEYRVLRPTMWAVLGDTHRMDEGLERATTLLDRAQLVSKDHFRFKQVFEYARVLRETVASDAVDSH